MPDTQHPPYGPSATIQPKQLNRWLDVNSQNGPLKRTRGFISIPAFEVEYTWNEYSDIVAAFNYTASANFSIKAYEHLRSISTVFTLCVAFKNTAGTVIRYRLNQAIGEVIYSDIPWYSGQKILKNFRFEIWSTPALIATLSAAITMFTTKLGTQDYRNGVDFTLGSATSVLDGFQNINTAITEPSAVSRLFWYDSAVNVTEVGGKVSAWGDASGDDNNGEPINLIQGTAGNRPIKAGGIVFTNSNFLRNDREVNFGDIFFLFYADYNDGYSNTPIIHGNCFNDFDVPITVYQYADNGTDHTGFTNYTDGTYWQVQPKQTGALNILRWTPSRQGFVLPRLSLYQVVNGTRIGTSTSDIVNSGGLRFDISQFLVGDETWIHDYGFVLYAMIGYGGICTEPEQTVAYLQQLAGQQLWSLPLTFNNANIVPSNS